VDRASLYFCPGSTTWVLCSAVDPLTPGTRVGSERASPRGVPFHFRRLFRWRIRGRS